MPDKDASQVGGMCFAGHDVPRGAFFCPRCGAPAVQATAERPRDTPPQGVWNGAAGYPPSSSYSPHPLYPPPAPADAYPPPAPAGVYPPPAPAGAYPQYGYMATRRRETNRLALLALAAGAVWVFWIGSLAAVVLGHVALYQIRANRRLGRLQAGAGAAVAALVLGYIGLAVLAITIVAGVASSAGGFN